MNKWEPGAAAAIVGLACVELWKMWGDNAPSLRDVRAAHPHDVVIRTQLMDAEFTVGGLALIIGLSFAVLTRDATVLILMLAIFGALAFFHHWVLDSEALHN